MQTFLLILGVLLFLMLLNFFMTKIFKASAIMRTLVVIGVILLLLGVLSLPHISISLSAILYVFAIVLILGFLLFLISKFFLTPGMIKLLVVLSVVLLLVSIFLVTYTTIKSDNEVQQKVVKNNNDRILFVNANNKELASGYSMKELDSVTAKLNRSSTFGRDISPSDLVVINRKRPVGI